VAGPDRLDAIVIGGGLAGTTAARDLAQRGFSTLLVEARDALGGRTATQRLAGREVDSGGSWFHWFQAAIWAEVQRYELPVVERPIAERWFVGSGDGLPEMDPYELDERLRRGLAAFWGDEAFAAALARPFAVQGGGDAVVALDARSVADRLREIALDPADERVLSAIFTDFGRPLEDVSLAWVLQRMGTALYTYEAFDALFAVYRLRDGMRGLIDVIVRDGGFEVRTSSPVTGVAHDADGVRVTLAGGETLEARAVVLATPVGVWPSISFDPPLPEPFAAAGEEGVAAPALSNVLMHVRNLPEPINTFASYGEEPFEFLFTYELLDDGEQLLAGYSMSGSISATASLEELQTAVRRAVPEAEVVEAVGHDWGSDPYARGGNGSLQRGQLTRFVDVLDRPQGRLFVASGDVAPHFPGFLTGAIEAGTRAAQRASAVLQS